MLLRAQGSSGRRRRRAATRQIPRMTHRLSKANLLVLALAAIAVPIGQASSQDGPSKVLLWSALDGKVTCGLGNLAAPGQERLLCFASSIPAPKNADPSIGDPGFVYLKAAGGAKLVRISQYSWEKGKNYGESLRPTPLSAGHTWKRKGLGVTCVIRTKFVRCTNGERHGFTVRSDSYQGH